MKRRQSQLSLAHQSNRKKIEKEIQGKMKDICEKKLKRMLWKGEKIHRKKRKEKENRRKKKERGEKGKKKNDVLGK